MYLDIGVKCPDKALFMVPHLVEPIKAKKIVKKFPEFAKLMDGEGKENTLLFYWKLNKKEGVYEFIDAYAEDEVAKLLGVAIYEGEDKDEEEACEGRPLTQEEINDFYEFIDEFNQGMKEWEEKIGESS